MNITKMILVFKKIAAVIPLLLFISGLILFAVAGFLANTIIGCVVSGICLIVLAVLLGEFKGGD